MEELSNTALQEIKDLQQKDVFQFVLVHFWILLLSLFVIFFVSSIISGILNLSRDFFGLSLVWYSIAAIIYAVWIFYTIFFRYDRMINRFNQEIQIIKNKKDFIEEQFMELTWYIEKDINEMGIDNWLVMKIKMSIDTIRNNITDYVVSVKKLGISKEFSWLIVNSKKFLDLQVKFTTSILQEMNFWQQNLIQLIQSWISHHATELAELEKQIASQELATENTGWKVALEISRISLQEHLKELEKVRV